MECLSLVSFDCTFNTVSNLRTKNNKCLRDLLAVLFLLVINFSLFCLQGVLRDEGDLDLFDDQFKDAYTAKRLGYFDDDDDESY